MYFTVRILPGFLAREQRQLNYSGFPNTLCGCLSLKKILKFIALFMIVKPKSPKEHKYYIDFILRPTKFKCAIKANVV